MKVHKVPQMNPKTQQKGYATRAVLNGQESWDDLIEYAARNTSIHKAELTAAATLIIEGAVMALKNGKSVDLRELGKIYPTVYGKWTETAEEQKKSNLTLGMNYRPSDEINEAIAGIKLSWSTKAEEEAETTDPENGGGNGGTSGGTQNGGSSSQSGSGSGSQSGNGGTSQSGGTSQNQNNNNSGGTTQSGGSSQNADGTVWLSIATSGNGQVTVTDERGVSSLVSGNRPVGMTYTVDVIPVAGQTPTAKLGGESLSMTENNGTYTTSFVMPDHNIVLEVFTGSNGNSGGDDLDLGDEN